MKAKKYFYANFNYIDSIKIHKSEVAACSHSGPCDDDVIRCMQLPYIKRQLAKISAESLKTELQQYGSWDESELNNHDSNLMRLLWIAAGDIAENPEFYQNS